MKTQRMNRKFLAAVCLITLWMGGCANKTNVAENEQVDGFADTAAGGDAAPTEGAAADAGATDPAADPASGIPAEATEAELFGDAKVEGAPADPNAPVDPNAPTNPNAADPAMDSLFAANQDPNAGAEPNFDELAGKQPESDMAKADVTPTPSTTPDPNADPLLAGGTSAPLTDPATPEAQAFSGNASFSEKPAPTATVARAPKIPGRALTRKGTSLNRYYFLRQGDTSKSVSELLYGDKSHANNLKRWNKGRWSAGKVIYYPSATQPDDAQMVSFYDERGLQGEEYKVGRGETMSAIAKKKLGSLSSWKEIAVVNGLTRPDSLKKGQTIKMYTNLAAGTPSMPVAQGSPEPIAPPPVEQIPTPTPVPNPEMAQAPAAVPPPIEPPPIDPMNEDLNKPKKKAGKNGVNIGKLISQNSFALAMGLGIGLLLIALMMINKRKRGNGATEEFGEDAFAAPEKKKRR